MPHNPPQLKNEKTGPFQSLIHREDDSAPWVVLLHGYGASAADLAPLSQVLLSGQKLNWLFLQGPMEILLGPHMTGYAWFPLDEKRLEQMALTGKPVSLVDLTPPPEFFQVAEAVGQALSSVVGDNKLLLGGFSQGAMLSLQVQLHLDRPADGLMLLSGSLANKSQWQTDLSRFPTPYFQSHGVQDPILGYQDAVQLHELLESCNWPGEFHEFQGGHEIPPQILHHLNQWMLKSIS